MKCAEVDADKRTLEPAPGQRFVGDDGKVSRLPSGNAEVGNRSLSEDRHRVAGKSLGDARCADHDRARAPDQAAAASAGSPG
jgi:hypothetical protein